MTFCGVAGVVFTVIASDCTYQWLKEILKSVKLDLIESLKQHAEPALREPLSLIPTEVRLGQLIEWQTFIASVGHRGPYNIEKHSSVHKALRPFDGLELLNRFDLVLGHSPSGGADTTVAYAVHPNDT